MKILITLASNYLERKGFIVIKEPTFSDRVSLKKILALVSHRSANLAEQINSLSDTLTMITEPEKVTELNKSNLIQKNEKHFR